MKKNKIKIIIALILPFIIVTYLFFCITLYFFEPVNYHAPDLSLSDFSFDLYDKFAFKKNNEFYIKQIDYTDVASAPGDKRLKYVDNTIIVISKPDVSYSDMDTLLDNFNGNICGYIDIVNFYQIDFADINFYDLQNICSELSNNNMVEIAIIDYFEETPVAETSSEIFTDDLDYYYHNLINSYTAWKITENLTSDITVGMVDIPVFSSHKDIDVINHKDYSIDLLENENIITSPSHGTHVAGIMASSSINKTPGICPNAKIYSENGINNSVSYWIAAIVNMIVNNNINVINISMGYNSYIPISASLGCEFSQKYITDENELFEAVLRNVLDAGYEFLICLAAGNESNYSLYRVNSDYFSYGDKEILRKWDIFDIFSSEPEYCEAKYQFSLTAIEDESVRDRIILVGSCDEFKKYSFFASAGDAVDIVAPGENIYSTGYSHEYEHMSGTSMASPLVAGTAALLFASDNSLTGAQIKDIIINTSSETVNAYGFNYPLLNTGNAVEYVYNK